MKQETKQFITSFYDGPSPRCPYCDSENTSYETTSEVPVNAMVDFSPNVLLITCLDCCRHFEYVISTNESLKIE